MRTNWSGERVLSTPRFFGNRFERRKPRPNISFWRRPHRCRAEPEPERYPGAHCRQGRQTRVRFAAGSGPGPVHCWQCMQRKEGEMTRIVDRWRPGAGKNIRSALVKVGYRSRQFWRSSNSFIQSRPFRTSRGLVPSGGPTIPSFSIKSIRCAARP